MASALGVAHLVEHRGEFPRGVRCGAADGSDSSGDILDTVRTLEFGQTLLERLEDVLPLIIASLAGIEQFIKGFFQLFKFCRTFLYVFS